MGFVHNCTHQHIVYRVPNPGYTHNDGNYRGRNNKHVGIEKVERGAFYGINDILSEHRNEEEITFLIAVLPNFFVGFGEGPSENFPEKRFQNRTCLSKKVIALASLYTSIGTITIWVFEIKDKP